MREILFHFDCQPGVILSFLFFSFYHCLPYWPWACEANRAAKASCGRFNIISLTETSDLFCMWSMKKCEPLCPRHRLTVTTHTETLCPLSVGCRESGAKKKKKKLSPTSPRALLCLCLVAQFFPFYSLPHAVSEHPAFFHQLLILIQRKPSGLHNRIFFFFLPSLPVALSAIPPTHVSLHFALFSINCASRQKGHRCFLRQGWRWDCLKSINFTPGATASPVVCCRLCPRSFQPPQI